MSKKQFKTESKQLLDLMIHSIYSKKEVFLREILSNASDALQKRRYFELKENKKDETPFSIQIKVDNTKRTITISDTGIGMNTEDADKFLGTIANSGTKQFVQSLEDNSDTTAIGQFGVGFYSSFIVADEVEVYSKKFDNKGIVWKSDGVSHYTLEECDKNEIGTDIVLQLREGEEFDYFLDTNNIQSLVKQHSDYIPFPIYLEKEVENEGVTELENSIINSQKAIWKKAKSELKPEELNEFYQAKYFDFQAPALTINAKLEGSISYDLLTFIPSHRPFDYFSGQYKKGLDLYSKEILIEEKAEYLLPDYLNFVRGVVDSPDISLNISREMLQEDHIVAKLKSGIEKKIVSELKKMQKKDREKYDAFWEVFNREITFGVYADYGAKKDLISDLLMYKTSKSEAFITLAEYVERNQEATKIYYASGKSVDAIKTLPAMESYFEKDIEVLYFINDVDEFAVQVMNSYKDIEFESVSISKQVDESDAIKEMRNSNADLVETLTESIKDEGVEISFSDTMTKSASRLASKSEISIEMEKTLKAMPGNEHVKADKVLEININHPIFEKISSLPLENKAQIENYAKLLLFEAKLSEGLEIEDKQSIISIINELVSNK